MEAKPRKKKGYCYLELFRSLNRSVGIGIDVGKAAGKFGPYPFVRRVVGFIVSHVTCDVLIPCVRMVSPSMYHVDKYANPIRLSDFIYTALFSNARIGADSALEHSRNVESLASLCNMAGLPFDRIMSEAARRQIDHGLSRTESFVHEAVRPMVQLGQQKFEVPYRMNAAQSAELQTAFPELNIVVSGRVAHPHAYAASATMAAEEIILKYFRYDANAQCEKGFDAAVVDVGANYPRHAKAGRFSVHCCTPILDFRDSARETTRTDTLHAAHSKGKLTLETVNNYCTPNKNTLQRCYNRAEDCTVRAPAMMFIHSQYDVTMDAFRDMLDAHQPRIVISVVNFLPSIFYEDYGMNEVLGVNFRRDGEDVVFDFVNDSSMGYRHNLGNLKEIYATQLVVTRGGRAYMCERQTRGCSLFLQYTYCSIAPQQLTFKADFSFWDYSTENVVVLSTWEYDPSRFAGSKLRVDKGIVGFKRKILAVDRRFYDLLYGHCIRSGDKSFNINEIFSAALTFNTKMCINGSDVHAKNRVPTVDFVNAVVAIYCIAYRCRFQAGKTIEAFVTAEKNKRADRHVGFSNFFGAAWIALSDSSDLGGLKNLWNRLLESMAKTYASTEVDVELFESVRTVRFSEFLGAHAKFDTTRPELYNVSIPKVNVTVKDNLLTEVVNIMKEQVKDSARLDAAETESILPEHEPTPKEPAPQQSATECIDVQFERVPRQVSRKKSRESITVFHARNSRKTSENSAILTSVRKEQKTPDYVCRERLQVRAMPADGHCVYHTLATIAASDQASMRAVLYEKLHDDSILILDGSRAGWGNTDAVTAFTELYNCRVCLHVEQDGVPFTTMHYTSHRVSADAPLYHIRWVCSGRNGHVDLLVPCDFTPLPPRVVRDSSVLRDDFSVHDSTDSPPLRVDVVERAYSPNSDPDAESFSIPSRIHSPDLLDGFDPLAPDDIDASVEHSLDVSCSLSWDSLGNKLEPFPAQFEDVSLEGDVAALIRRYDLDEKFAGTLAGGEFVWLRMAHRALAYGTDPHDNLDSIGVYNERAHYDLDSILNMLPGRNCAYAGPDRLPPSLNAALPCYDAGSNEIYDVIISSEFNSCHLARLSQLYIVRVPSPVAQLPDIIDTTKVVFRARFTHVSDMTAYVVYHKSDRKYRFSDWYVSLAATLNTVIRGTIPIDSALLRMMLRDTVAGGFSEFLENINECVQHERPSYGCPCCVYLSNPNDPLVVQCAWVFFMGHALRLRSRLGRHLKTKNRTDLAILHYLEAEERRCAKTGYKERRVVSFAQVDDCSIINAVDAVAKTRRGRAKECAQLGTHVMEHPNARRVHVTTYGVTSQRKIEFVGSNKPGTLNSATQHECVHADVRRITPLATTEQTCTSIRDAATSTETGSVFLSKPRARTLVPRTILVHTASCAVQADFPCLPLLECQPAPKALTVLEGSTSDDSDAESGTSVESQVAVEPPQVHTSAADEVQTKRADAPKSEVCNKSPKQKSLLKRVDSALKKKINQVRKQIQLGTSVTSTDTDFSPPPERFMDIRKNVLNSMPTDLGSDVLATKNFGTNFPYGLQLHVVVMRKNATRLPELLAIRRSMKELQLLKTKFVCLGDDLYYDPEHVEFVLLASGAYESCLHAFFSMLPTDCARISVTIDCPMAEVALANSIVSLKRKVCLIEWRSQSWAGVLSLVNKESKPLQAVSAPLAFPRKRPDLSYPKNPPWIDGNTRDDAYNNSMIEFNHITAHADNFNKNTFRRLNFDSKNGPAVGDLETLCSEGIQVFDNSPNRKMFLGTKPRQMFSHAYSAAGDVYVPWNSKTQRFDTDDRFLLTNRYTETMLNQEILANISTVTIGSQPRPKITWINGPPGCGKTYTIVNSAKMSQSRLRGLDIVLSMTKEGRESILKAMIKKYPDIPAETLQLHVRTVASVLVNGSKTKYERVLLDEALMAHAGTIGYVAALTGSTTALIIGDIHQIPYVDRDHMCELRFYSPACYADITTELSITYRCPMDVTYVLKKFYDGLCTKSTVPCSLRRRPYSSEKACIRKDLKDCLYLVHFQADKDALIREGYGKATGSKVLTIHEAQGLTFQHVICVRTNSKALMLYDKVEYAIVAISRHTKSFVYYSDQSDAITRLIDNAITDAAWLCDWNRKRLDATTPPRLIGGGYLYESEPHFECAHRNDSDLNLASGLPQISHPILRLAKPFRVQNCLRAPPQWKGAPECDIAYLQAFYDSCMPAVSEFDYDWDQLMVESEDTYLRSTEITVKPGHGLYREPPHGTLRPRLRTIMQRKKIPSQKESILGAIKRNLNAPELTNPALSPKEIGYMLFENFQLSGIDPSKLHVYNSFADDKVSISSPLIAEWLEKQPPNRQAQIVSDLPLHLRPYNRFNYMVKTEVKPQLAPSAKHTYPSVQTIIYNDPSVNAIFCPIFNVLFERLISVLHPKILLLTGMSKPEFERELNARITPEFAARLRAVEDDFSKFDKAQQEALRVLEDLLWRSLGLDPELARIWDRSRRYSRVYDRHGGITFRTRFQRKSGEATTFSGNTLVAVCIMLAIFDIDDIVLLLAAGDDTLVYLRDGVEVMDSSRLIADLFNLECKLLDRYHIPYFCSAFIVPTPTWTYVVPDPLKFVTKLGRRDMKNFEHVEEYRVSCVDTMQSLFNMEVSQGLGLAIAERYGGFSEVSKLQAVLRTICYSPELFATLFVHDRNVIIYDPKKKVKAKHVTARL
uniref:Replicase large subunit n=1 Tax=Atrato Virga-like virus 2 TaxID=2689341 RepID=A0A6B9KGN7_9VIRU|nr:polyprotein [Atrato Virga-like virus 2]